MKPILITIAFFAIFSIVNAQQRDTAIIHNDNKIYTAVEHEPEFPGGITAFFKFLSNNFKYPKTAADVSGKVMVQFIVEKDGTLSHIKVFKKLWPELDAEAIRVMKLSPKWKPAMLNGRIVRALWQMPINIEVSDE